MNKGFLITLGAVVSILIGMFYWGGHIASGLPLVLYQNMPRIMLALLGLSLFVAWLYRKPFAFYTLMFALPVATAFTMNPTGYLAAGKTQAESLQLLILILLSINSVAFTLIKNRSVMNRASLKWWGLLALQWALIYVFSRSAFVLPPVFLDKVSPVITWMSAAGFPWQFTDMTVYMVLATVGYLLVFLLVKQISLQTSSLAFYGLFTLALVGDNDYAFIASMASVALLFYLFLMLFESYRLAFYDELTSLPSRRALQESMKSLGKQYVIAMLDIDHFKRINDRYGHDIGDQVLRFVALKIQKHLRGGRVFRYGGEEFALVFPSKHMNQISHHLESLRERIEGDRFNLRSPKKRLIKGRKARARAVDKKRSQHICLTVSIGAAECVDANATADNVIKTADKGVYAAKKRGRNRVILMPSK